MYKNSTKHWKQIQDVREAYSSLSPEAIAQIKRNNAMTVKQVRDAELAKKYGSNEPIDDEGFPLKCRD
jgi:hypothetical protein